jgi:hypothetical protein
LVTRPELHARGWTDTAIKKFLGTHDGEQPNPRYRHAGSPMKLWKAERANAVEETDQFQEWLKKSIKRREAAAKAVETKREKVFRFVMDWEPTVSIPEGNVLALAIQHYNDQSIDGRSASPRSDPAFLQRITGNYLRHCCTDYEFMLSEIQGRVGADDAYEDVRMIVDVTLDEVVSRTLSELGLSEEEIRAQAKQLRAMWREHRYRQVSGDKWAK